MTGGSMKYFTSAFVTIKIIREHLKCALPIEVFYAGVDEMPAAAPSYMLKRFDVKLIDITKLQGVCANCELSEIHIVYDEK